MVKGAFQATEEVGTGLPLSSKSVAKGMVMGISDVGGDEVSLVGQTVQGTVKVSLFDSPAFSCPAIGRIFGTAVRRPDTAFRRLADGMGVGGKTTLAEK